MSPWKSLIPPLAIRVPPLDGDGELTTCDQDPKWQLSIDPCTKCCFIWGLKGGLDLWLGGSSQGHSQPHSPGWARVPLSSFFPWISINFSSNFTYFLPHFGPPGGRVAHPRRLWLRHWLKPPTHWLCPCKDSYSLSTFTILAITSGIACCCTC